MNKELNKNYIEGQLKRIEERLNVNIDEELKEIKNTLIEEIGKKYKTKKATIDDIDWNKRYKVTGAYVYRQNLNRVEELKQVYLSALKAHEEAEQLKKQLEEITLRKKELFEKEKEFSVLLYAKGDCPLLNELLKETNQEFKRIRKS